MEIRSRRGAAEDAELSARPGMEGLHVWRLASAAKTGSRSLIFDVVDVEPGSAHALHRHPHAEQMTYVLRGSGVHLSEDGRTSLAEGDTIFIAAGEWHGFENDTEETVTILGVFGAGSPEEAGYEDYPPPLAGGLT